MSNWIPQDQLKAIDALGKDPGAKIVNKNIASQVATLYHNKDVDGAKDLYRTAGLDEGLTDEMGDNANAKWVPNPRTGIMKDTGTKLWNAHGVLNAPNNSQALDLLENHALRTIWNPKSSFIKTAIQDPQKEALMESIQKAERMGNHEPLGRIVAQLQRPVRQRLDYMGFARKSFITHEVGQGEIPYYDIDPLVSAYTVANDAAVPASRVEANRIFPQRERIMAFVQIAVDEAAIRSFNLMERAKDLAIQDIQRKEDQRALNAWWVAGHDTNTPVVLPPTLTLGAIEQMGYTIDQNDLHATRMYMNRQELKDIRTNIISQFDPVTQREVFNTGILGVLYDYLLYVSPVQVPKGYVFATAEPDYTGYIALWINTTAEIAHRFNLGEPVYGFLFFEVLAFTVVNDGAVSVGIKTGSPLPPYFTPNP